MQFNVKGITFNHDDLEKIELTEIKTETISHAHYFHMLSDTRAILILRAGDFVEPSFITKYLEKGMNSLHQLSIINKEDLLIYKQKWSQLKVAKTQILQMKVRDELIKKVSNDFWHSNEKSFLSFVIAAYEEFYQFEPLVLENFQEKSMIMYTRTLLTSSIATLVSLCNGIVDYKFIKDMYNTTFLLDYGMIAYDNFSYVMAQACEAERNRPGSGPDYLVNLKRSEREINLFKNHPELSYNIARDFEKDFTYPEVLDLILLHHEKCDGSGFPKGYSYSGISDTATLLMFCDYMIPFEEHIFSVGDGQRILYDYFKNLSSNESKYLLPINKVLASWEGMMAWAKDINQKIVDECEEEVAS